jgi:protein O-mannosyl-transferase
VKKPLSDIFFAYPLWILFILSASVIALYYPGLDSGFILDDLYGLGGLDYIKSEGYLEYVFSGGAGASGRPIALMTFALQHNAWPGNPYAFKIVNLLIHIVNGCLIYYISGRLAQLTSLTHKQVVGVQVLTCFLWLIHPMHISTVLYVVQRMAQLSTLFMLLGIANHLYLRDRFASMTGNRELLLMGMSLGMFTVAAVFSKENGILLPLYIIVIESTVLNKIARPDKWRLWTWVFLYAPLLILLIYLISKFDGNMESYQMRTFTVVERLLTEARILMDYIRYLLFPHPDAFSLFHDDYPISSGFLSPPMTLVSVITISGAIFFSIKNRKVVPVISFSVLWFFSGHILESSYLPLELYFEHRNYLPSFGLFFLLVYAFIKSLQKLNNSKYILIFVAVYFVLVSIVSVSVINVWSNPYRQSVEWLRTHPESARALDNLGLFYLLHGEVEEAVKAYDEISKVFPDHIYPHLKKITITYCLKGESLTENEWRELFVIMKNARLESYAGLAEINSLTASVNLGKCQLPDIFPYMKLLLILANNTEFKQYKGGLHALLSGLSIKAGDGSAALENIRESVKLTPTVPRLIFMLRILIALDLKEEAEQTIIRIRSKEKQDPRVYFAYHKSVSKLEKQLYK